MKFYHDLYVGKSLEKKRDKIIEKLESNKLQLSCYVIALTENPKNQLEFFDSVQLMQKNFQRSSMFVVGLASCYVEALDVIREITEDTYLKNQNADIRGYILEQQREFEEGKV